MSASSAPACRWPATAGLEAITGPRDVERARREIEAAGYGGEKVVVMSPGDYPRINALASVAADMLQRCGLNVDLQQMDWGTVIQRRASKAPPSQGGWSVFFTTLTGVDMSSPAGSLPLRGNGQNAWFGWPTAPRLEALRDQFLVAPDLAGAAAHRRRHAAAGVHGRAVPAAGRVRAAHHAAQELTGTLSGLSLFWNVRRA